MMRARPDQCAAKSQARRRDRDQDADLARHGDRLPPLHHRRDRSRATSSRRSRASITARRFSRPTLYPAIAANPFVTFHTVATESGTLAFTLDRRQRLRGDRRGEDCGRSQRAIVLRHARRPAIQMRVRVVTGCPASRACMSLAALRALSPALAEIPLDRAPLRLRPDEPPTPRRCRTTTRRIPRTLSVLDGEALWKRKAGQRGQVLRRLPRRRRSRDARRLGALSGVRARRKAGRSTSSSASISAAPSSRRRRRLRYESRELLALTAYRRQAVARRCRSRSRTTRRQSRSSRRAAQIIQRRQGQLNLSCQNCHDDNWGQKLAGIAAGAGPSDRLSALSARMAEHRLAAAPPAQLPDRHARGALCLRVATSMSSWSCT